MNREERMISKYIENSGAIYSAISTNTFTESSLVSFENIYIYIQIAG